MHFKNMNDLLPFKFQFDVCTGGQWGVPPLLAFRPRKIKYTKKNPGNPEANVAPVGL